jgi:hypothetical protein
MITVVLEKPANASLGANIWNSKRAKSEHKATRSDLTFPLTNRAADIRRIITVISMSCYRSKGVEKR